jgi:hypothetical protein
VLMGKVAAGLRPPIPDHPFPLYEDLVLLMQGECVVAMPFPLRRFSFHRCHSDM